MEKYTSKNIKAVQIVLKDFLKGHKSGVLVEVSIAMKRYNDNGNSYKRMNLVRLDYSFRDLVHFWHTGHAGMQAEMVLETELTVFYLDL